MAHAFLDGGRIDGWAAFHDACRTAFGFPDYYGRNMDAWVDCMSGLRDDDDMTSFVLAADEMLEIEVGAADTLRRRAPHILQALQDCVDEVNTLCAEHGEKPALLLVLR
ncbi:MAG TPA: barstar family protein [Noviherbaspirillum sp.]|jgi:RNAse (barnase) inhibitor barstar|uniref:barstar family protein n=1 Tax=Noviherbaspirillum sp. TaxID=1926288 RepID=UPI002F93C55D